MTDEVNKERLLYVGALERGYRSGLRIPPHHPWALAWMLLVIGIATAGILFINV